MPHLEDNLMVVKKKKTLLICLLVKKIYIYNFGRNDNTVFECYRWMHSQIKDNFWKLDILFFENVLISLNNAYLISPNLWT